MIEIRLKGKREQGSAKEPGKKRRNVIFNEEESDGENDNNRNDLPTQPVIQKPLVPLKRTAASEKIDEAIYDYDAAYDALHASRTAAKAAAKEEARQRQPRFMEGLLTSARVRKGDQFRAREQLLKKQREAEGDTYADRETFITSTYEKHLADNQRITNTEAIREAVEADMRKTMGMRKFYANMLDAQEIQHREILEAAERIPIEPTRENKGSSTDNDKEDNDDVTSDAAYRKVAEKLIGQGVLVELNDDGHVTDKRQLLTGGLNFLKSSRESPNDRNKLSPANSVIGKPTYNSGKPEGQTYREIRERQTRLIERQITDLAKLNAENEKRAEDERKERAKSRKTEDDVKSARERYLQRKRDTATAAEGVIVPGREGCGAK